MKIQLNRSGGLLGKTMKAIRELDMDEEEIIKKIKKSVPEKNAMARDAFHYSLIINDVHSFPVDIDHLKGELKKLVAALNKELKV